MESLGIEHGVRVDGHEQVRITDLLKSLALGVTLAPVASPLPGGVNTGNRCVPEEPVALFGVGALARPVIDDMDLSRRGALVQQRPEHSTHDVGVLVVQRDKHGNAVVVTLPDHASLETGEDELSGDDDEDDVESPHEPGVQGVPVADEDAPVQPSGQTEGDEDGGRKAGCARESPGQPGGQRGAPCLLATGHGRPGRGQSTSSGATDPYRCEGEAGLEEDLDREAGEDDEEADKDNEESE